MIDTLNRTSLYANHVALGAKMVEFGGWEMPVQYTSILQEHKNTREKSGIFDICHMGEFSISGRESLPFLQNVSTNNVAGLKVGQGQYSVLCNEEGGVIDDIIIYHISENEYMMVVNAANIQKDYDWLQEHTLEGMKLQNISDNSFNIAVQGPTSRDLLCSVIRDSDVGTLKYFDTALVDISSVPVRVARTGYTGELGYELYGDAQSAPDILNTLLDRGKEFGAKPVGLGARDTLRLEVGYSLYGHELTTNVTPLEAGLGWVVKLQKGEFIGSNVLEDQKRQGVKKKLIAFEMESKAIPRTGCLIYIHSKERGKVTSGSFGPSVGKSLGLGFVSCPVDEKKMEIEIRGKRYNAQRVSLPFYKEGTVKS